MSDDNSIEKLYKNFGVLADAKDKLSEHEQEYLEILKAVKGSPKEKRLASQFIARFFKHFPKLADKAIEALLGLCKDEDISIRKQAIKDLPTLCKENKDHTLKIASILAELFGAEDSTELAVVHNSIMTLIKNDPKGTLSGIFSKIYSGDDATRERCIKFLSSKLKAIGHDVITKEPEDVLISECKKVLQDVTGDEFHNIMEILTWTKLGSTIAGQQELVDIAVEKAELSVPFRHTNLEQLIRLMECIKHALPFFSSQVYSTKFVSYICIQVLPHLSLITTPDKGDAKLQLLKLLAELVVFCGALDKPEEKVQQLYNALITYMPLPPDTEVPEEPKLQFSHVECLMFSFHRICKQVPEFLVKDSDQLKEFRLRLQYFARGTQGYIKVLREAINGKSEEEMKKEENQLKVIALKITSNINTLIKDLFHSPPSFKSIIQLSWVPKKEKKLIQVDDKDKDKDKVKTGTKRHTPITFGNGNSNNHSNSKKMRQDHIGNSKRELYQPPSGKYSSSISPNYGNRGGRQFNNRYNKNGVRGSFRPKSRGGWRKPY